MLGTTECLDVTFVNLGAMQPRTGQADALTVWLANMLEAMGILSA